MDLKELFALDFFDNIGSVNLIDTVILLFVSFLVGLFMFYIYKTIFSGVMFSLNFGISLIGLTMVSSLVVLAVANNVVLSLGMVGALSIIRFRTAIKDPLDTVFLFWAIVAGIIVAAGMILLAIIGSGLIGLVLIFFVKKKTNNDCYIVSINCADEAAKDKAMETINSMVEKSKIRSIEIAESNIEMNILITMADNQVQLIQDLNKISGVKNAVMVNMNQ